MEKQACILVVDDEPKICNLLQTILSSEGYEVETVEDGNQALQCIDKKYYNVVVTDMVLPTTTGINIIKHMKKTSPDTIG